MMLFPLPQTLPTAQGNTAPSVQTLLSPRVPQPTNGLNLPYKCLTPAETTHAAHTLQLQPLALDKRERYGKAYGENFSRIKE